jgi:hypothetical protein
VVLSTHSFQAPGFYARFGYVECGRARGYPRGHHQIYLVNSLVQPGGAVGLFDRSASKLSGRTTLTGGHASV